MPNACSCIASTTPRSRMPRQLWENFWKLGNLFQVTEQHVCVCVLQCDVILLIWGWAKKKKKPPQPKPFKINSVMPKWEVGIIGLQANPVYWTGVTQLEPKCGLIFHVRTKALFSYAKERWRNDLFQAFCFPVHGGRWPEAESWVKWKGLQKWSCYGDVGLESDYFFQLVYSRVVWRAWSKNNQVECLNQIASFYCCFPCWNT